ncbi:MAG: hypothetical protein PHY43_12475 [Verrucomicrobiales bacterium]|nr:hypothetical protein [Verrucomicrobiales bacterium]
MVATFIAYGQAINSAKQSLPTNHSLPKHAHILLAKPSADPIEQREQAQIEDAGIEHGRII